MSAEGSEKGHRHDFELDNVLLPEYVGSKRTETHICVFEKVERKCASASQGMKTFGN